MDRKRIDFTSLKLWPLQKQPGSMLLRNRFHASFGRPLPLKKPRTVNYAASGFLLAIESVA
jgi:hypothetical protein